MRALGRPLADRPRPTAKTAAESSPPAAGPEKARSNRSVRFETSVFSCDTAPKEPIWPLGTNSAGPSRICAREGKGHREV